MHLPFNDWGGCTPRAGAKTMSRCSPKVLNHLRGFGGEAVHGIDDRHAVTGRTALHEAVMLNRLTSVEILLQAGADPNVGHSTQVRCLRPSDPFTSFIVGFHF